MKKWIYLSPHFDDVALSVGGMAWELTQRGDQVEIWTICAGDPPFDKPLTDYAEMLHIFWELGDEDIPFARSTEDAASCKILGASYRRYTVPDNIYRYFPGTEEAVVKVPENNFGPLEPLETYLIPAAADFMRKNLSQNSELVTPLGIGNHRDHVLTRKAAERLGISLWHYVDYPYILRQETNLAEWIPPIAEKFTVEITPAGLKAWQDGFACHRSQIIFLWPGEEEMRVAIQEYWGSGYGNTIWKF